MFPYFIVRCFYCLSQRNPSQSSDILRLPQALILRRTCNAMTSYFSFLNRGNFFCELLLIYVSGFCLMLPLIVLPVSAIRPLFEKKRLISDILFMYLIVPYLQNISIIL